MNEHPITKSVREAKERARATVSQIYAGKTPSAEDLHNLATQYIATEAVGKASKVHASTGLYFHHPAALDPPPKDGESFLIVFTDAKGRTCIEPACWDEEDDWWCTDNESRRNDEIYAALRIPDDLTKLQRVGVDEEARILAEEEP